MKPIPRATLAAAVLLAAAACDNPSDSSRSGPPARLDVLSGDQQTDTVGQELPQPLVVRVTDDRGRPVRNQVVVFRIVSQTGGSLFAGTAITNNDGEVRERWTLGTVADSQKVEARAVDPATGQALVFGTFRATAVPDAPAALQRQAELISGQSGQALADSIRARVIDQHGNGIPGVTITWSANNGGSVSPATSQTRADGYARTQWTLGPALGNQTAQASAPGLPAVTFTATGTVGPPMGIRIEPRDIRFTALRQDARIRVEAFDALGHPLGPVQAKVASLQGNIVSVSDTITPVLLFSVMNGTAQIVARYQGAVDTLEVVVQQEAARIAVLPDSAFTLVGEQVNLAADVRDANEYRINGAPVGYTSSAPGVASVSGDGQVQSHAVGSATVTAQAAAGVQDPVKVEVFNPFSAARVDAGTDLTCAVDAGGTARCWGYDNDGQAGTSAGEIVRTPALVQGGHAWADVQAAGFHGGSSCGLTTAGKAYCWGPGPAIGNGSASGSDAPAAVSGNLTFAKIAVGGRSNCGLTTAGEVYCWGNGEWGVLGNGDTVSSTVPVKVSSSLQFMDVAVGQREACALASDGTAWCWGEGVPAPPYSCASNLLGPTCSFTPVQVGGSRTFVQVVAGFWYKCGLATDGAVYCGQNLETRVGPVGGPAFVSITAGWAHLCGRTSGGEAWCWGTNTNGQLGNSTVGSSDVPVRAAPSLAFTSLSAGLKQTCGVATDGGVYCWGGEQYGELGDGWVARNGQYEPIRVRTR